MPRQQWRATISDGSEAGFQAGGPVGVRAVPTALRWKIARGSPPSTIAPPCASRGWWVAGRRTGALTGGSPSVVSTSDGRDRIPSVTGSAEISPAAGSLPSVPWYATGASWAPAGAATARSRGSKGRAPGARTRMTANHAASQGCSLPPRCARASTGTPVVSRRDRTPPDRGAVGDQTAWSSPGVASSGSSHGSARGCAPVSRAPAPRPVQGCSGAIRPGGGFGYTRRPRYLEVRS